MNEQHHEMVLEMTHASGMQGWYCPTCGRRILLQVPPNNDLVIIEVGDQYASHSGSTGGLRIGAVQVSEQQEQPQEISEESLRPWIKALEDLDLDW
ncbi:MAG TPA: hypothetical protein VK206_09915 [Anaerolineales bacterium]|nr:hypothetical protein [Anaerolineales bacterium]